MSSALTTQILIDRVQHGDRSALNDLCARYQQRVLRAVRIRLGSKLRRKIESWEIVQEVLMGAFGRLNSGDFGTEGALMNYLSRLAENRIRDEADRQGAQRRNADREIPLDARSPGGGDPLIEIEAPTAPGPSSLLVLAEDLERMERAMDRLSAGQSRPSAPRRDLPRVGRSREWVVGSG